MGKHLDLTNKKFGRLVVKELLPKRTTNGARLWRCLCDCGKENIVTTTYLQSGHTKSCGCLSSELTAQRNTTHGCAKRRLREYDIWRAMKRRCTNSGLWEYTNYGARGITVCERWQGVDGFPNFLQDLGKCPTPKHTLDRINVNGNYEPSNCRWATSKEQANNRRTKRIENFLDAELIAEVRRRNLVVE